jgi:3-phosphoglycerate kinase
VLNSVKTLDKKKLHGKRILLRLDLDVPIHLEGYVTEDFRLQRCLPTVRYLKEAGAKVIIIGHIGSDGEESLKPVAQWFDKNLPQTGFVPSLELKEVLDTMYAGNVLMLENLRRLPGEKGNDEAFAKQLAKLGDIYVNDSFATSHRKHASIVGLPKFLPSYMGLNLEQEVEQLSKAFQPQHPFLFILGGAKFDTKGPLVEKFLQLADTVFISGALANSFYKARGDEVKKSLVDENLDLVKPFLGNPKIILPDDLVWKDEKILDAGSKAVEQLKKLISEARFILWNGPLGNFEDGFTQATDEAAKAVAASGAFSVIGGGDTIASIEKLNLLDKFGFVSTGGGAMLDFLANNGKLPGLEALENCKK